MKEKKKRDWKSIIGISVLISFIAPIAFIIYKIIVSPTTNVEQIEGVRVKTDYILMLTQCVLGVIAFFLPNMLSIISIPLLVVSGLFNISYIKLESAKELVIVHDIVIINVNIKAMNFFTVILLFLFVLFVCSFSYLIY